MSEPSECDLCKLEARGVMAVQFSVFERADVTVCERHLQMLREQ
jgi:hypothetical protein